MSGKAHQQYRWSFGEAQLDESTLQFTIAGKPQRLEPKPLKLLVLLLRHAGEVVTREEILETVWENRATVEHSLSTAVGKLRKAITPSCAIEIETIPRAGYRLTPLHTGTIERAAVGRMQAQRLTLKAGDRVRATSDFKLFEQINATLYCDIWLAGREPEGTRQVLKFAVDGARLSHLKREATLNRILIDALGVRGDIARMTETNFSSPPFFLAYEYEGINLRQWATTQPAFAALSVPRRLELFQRICKAVAAAHGVGVLHKDIKPENILISEQKDGELSVKLGDFGNSELLEPEQLERLQLTASGLAVTRDSPSISESGTVLYMAPELLQTRTATIRSDVYSLGVLLYQLLTGDFNKTLTPGWQRAISDPLLIEDIAAATDQDPNRRPASVEELSMRISTLAKRRQRRESERHNRELLARSRASLERQRARRPWIWGVFGSLVLALVLSLFLYREAEQGRRLAERFVDNMLAIQRFISDDVIHRASPTSADYDLVAGIEPILENAARQIESRFNNAPLAAAGLHRTFGNVFSVFRSDQPAFEHFDRAIELFEAHLGHRHDVTIQTRYEKVRALIIAGHYDNARQLLARVDRRASAMQKNQGLIGHQRAFIHGQLHAGFHDMKPALENFRRSRRIFKDSGEADPDHEARLGLAIVDALIRLSRPEEALAELDRLEIDDSPDLGADIEFMRLRNLARIQRDLGATEAALDQARSAVTEAIAVYGDAHYQTIITLSLVAQLQAELEDCPATLATSERVFELMQEVYGPAHSASLIELGNLGAKQFGCGSHDKGIANLRNAISGLHEQFGNENRAVYPFRFFLAKYLHQTGENEEALAILNLLIEKSMDKTEGVTLTPAQLLLWRARVLASIGRFDDAESSLRQAIDAVKPQDRELIDEINAELAKTTRT